MLTILAAFLSKISAKALVILVAILFVMAGVLLYGHSRYDAGKRVVQASWDAANAKQNAEVVRVEASQIAHTASVAGHFDAIAASFEEQAHAQADPLAGTLSAAVTAGTFRLRDSEAVCPADSHPAAAASGSRAADAAATQALADRTAAAIAAVRAGDAADQREKQLDAQVIALQALLKAERQ